MVFRRMAGASLVEQRHWGYNVQISQDIGDPMPSAAPASPTISPARVLFPLGLATALSLMGDATLYTVLPTHSADAGIALGSVGLMLGANRAIRLLSNGATGYAYDRLPRRSLFVPALFLGALSTAIYAGTQGFWPLLLGRLLWGLSWSGIWVGGATVILDISTAANRGRWTGLYQTWFFLGATMGSFGGGLLTDSLGYAQALWIGAGLTLVGALLALWLLPETRGLRPEAGETTITDPEPTAETPLRANAPFWGAVMSQCANRFITAGVLSATMGLLVQGRLAESGFALGVATLTGLLTAGRTTLSMLVAPLAGTLSDRLGNRWLVMVVSLAAGAVGLGLTGAAGLWPVLIGILVGAAASGSVQSLATTLTGDLVGRAQRGRAIGLQHTVGDLGSALGPPVAYALLPLIGLPGIYWLCAALFALAAIPAGRFARRRA